MEFHEVVYIWPKMQADEFSKLVEDVRSHGLREPLWTYQGKIIDGRHRYLACKESGVTPRYEEWNGEGSLLLFVASLNQHRRHLDAGQKAMVALELEKQLGIEAEKRAGGRPLKSVENSINSDKPVELVPQVVVIRSAVQAASLTGTNAHYVTDAKRIIERAPELREAVMNRTISLPDAKRLSQQEEPKRAAILKKIVDGEVKNVKQGKAIVKQEAAIAQAKSVTLPATMRLLHGDFRFISDIADNSVDLVFTDPPYHNEHLGLWADLSTFAERVLKPGGILLSYSGQLFLPHVLNGLSEHLEYCWMLAMTQNQGHIQIWKHQLWNDWKPLVMFSKGKPRDHEWINDLALGDKGDKDAHAWSQGEGHAAYYINKLTTYGEMVVDPMCGSGTIVRAAERTGRRSIGIEIDKRRYEVALGEMKQLQEAS